MRHPAALEAEILLSEAPRSRQPVECIKSTTVVWEFISSLDSADLSKIVRLCYKGVKIVEYAGSHLQPHP
jgi:hypothetical protein